jgi:high-affinity Fe2+/Pb2+ permease
MSIFDRKCVMRIELASSAVVETVVTLAAAAMMTLAGLAMLEDAVTAQSTSPTLVTHAVATPASG